MVDGDVPAWVAFLDKYWKIISAAAFGIFISGGGVYQLKSNSKKIQDIKLKIEDLEDRKQDKINCGEKRIACTALIQEQLRFGEHQFKALTEQNKALNDKMDKHYDEFIAHIKSIRIYGQSEHKKEDSN